jgi:glycosyltransferase involved in cell wall biosynthesis
MLTLVVCTLGRAAPLRRLLTSLRLQTKKTFKIVAVDQNEPGFLAPVLAEFADLPIAHAQSPRGLSRARNIGVALTQTPLVGFPDDDCWYAPETVAEVVRRFHDNPQMQVMTGRTVDAEGRDSVSLHLPHSQRITRANVFLAGNSNSFFARHGAVVEADGFDETLGVGSGTRFGSGEETDFLLRCLARDFEVRYERDLTVHHDQVERDPGRAGSYSAGFGRVARLHGLGAGFVGSRIARAAATSCLCLCTGRIAEARSRWSWIAGCVAGFTAPP